MKIMNWWPFYLWTKTAPEGIPQTVEVRDIPPEILSPEQQIPTSTKYYTDWIMLPGSILRRLEKAYEQRIKKIAELKAYVAELKKHPDSERDKIVKKRLAEIEKERKHGHS